MDDGHEIPGLNETWTFAGAKASEWVAGLAGMFIFTGVANINAARSMPLLLAVWLFTTFTVAMIRRRFPDEERGVRNCFMDALGFAPPGTPRQASLQPYWSGCRVQRLKEESWYRKLGLEEVFASEPEEDDDN